MKGCQGYTVSQSGSPPTFLHTFDGHWKVVCVFSVYVHEDETERGRGQKEPLLCLQQQGLAAEKREEKRGEDCVWNCPSVAVVVLSHFISATAARFPPISLLSDYSSTLLEQEKHSLSHHGQCSTITNLFFPHLPCSRYLFTQHRSLSKCFFFFFHCSAPSYLQKCRVLKNCHTSLRLHILFLSVHLTSGLGCKYRTVSGYLEDFLERVQGFYTQYKTLEFYLENRLRFWDAASVKN